MKHRVFVQPAAAAEIERAYLRISEEAPETATRWYNSLYDAILSLGSNPSRCSLCQENDAFEHEIRQLLYGRKGRRYRILFTLRDEVVHVLHFRHWAQRPLTTAEARRPQS